MHAVENHISERFLNRNSPCDKSKIWIVTGASGFLGINFIEALIALDLPFVGIDRNMTNIRELGFDSISHQGFFIESPLEDPSWVQKIQRKNSNKFAIAHLASSIIHQNRSIHDLDSKNLDGQISITYSNEQKSILNLLEIGKDSIEFFGYASTIDVYGKQFDNLNIINEATVPSPVSVYAQMKLQSEQFVRQECDKIGIPHQIFRLGHIYGPHEDLTYSRLLPVALKSIKRNEKMSINVPRNFSRQYIYTLDIVSEFLGYDSKSNHTLKNVIGRSISSEEIVDSLNQLSNLELFSLGASSQKDDYRALIKSLTSESSDTTSNIVQENFISGLRSELNAIKNF